MKLLEVENLTVQYPGSTNPACKVSFQVESGELLGIAGASGAGKSTAMLSLMGILPEQVQITSEKLKQHGTKAMIFQDASASLNPLVRVGKQLTETILAHQRCTGKEARERAETLLDEVGIQNPGQRMKQYPFELSGGMKQRVAIAIALACNPDLIIADEPTTALDVTIQAQIMKLLKEIQEKGVDIARVTLHVGLGTFRPVKVEDVTEHHMHSEFYMVDAEAAEKINKAKEHGGRVICVGTTSCRTIESAADENGRLKPCSGWTEIFIYPGYQFKILDGLITNFHLPESTLIMLVSALAGKEHVMAAYEEAVKERYRFFSFGDAMIIL